MSHDYIYSAVNSEKFVAKFGDVPKLQLVAYLYKNKASTVLFLGALLGVNLPHLWLQ